MPQMAPLNWLTLYIFFIFIFIMFIIQNYFHKTSILNPMIPINKNETIQNWKW